MASSPVELLASLAESLDLARCLAIIAKLEGRFGFSWLPVGGREGNFGSINIGSDPGHAFVERITNAIDAVIERESFGRRAKTKQLPASPREAVEAWFGVPGGRVSNLPIQERKGSPKGSATRQRLAEEVIIQIHDGESKKQPTLVVRDHGIGLMPKAIPSTILSLNETNKIDKPFLAGAYGQGGSTALAFSPSGTLIVSRRQPGLLPSDEPDLIAITFVRFNELDPNHNKNGRFEYLVGRHGGVAGIPASSVAYEPGTTVVHFNYELPQYSARMTQVTGSLWWLLQNALFDPVLPFWVEERRASMLEKGKKADRRTIAGNYTRLMDDKKERVEHYDNIDVRVGQNRDSSVRVNYWVIKVNPDNPGGQPIDAYIDPHRPITFTYNGQTHGTDERRFIAERLSLPYLSKYLIIQVELDHLTSQTRRSLLSTTRDRLKQLAPYEELREAIASALSEDEELVRLNEERKERLLSKHSEAEQAKMRERFARLLERFRAGTHVMATGKGSEAQGRKHTGRGGSREPLDPLPTGDSPTFIRIANVQKPVPVRLDRHTLVRIESDAPDDYLASHVHARLAIACEPEGLVELESRSDFRGGRSRLTIRPGASARARQTGSLTVFLLTPEERTYSAKVNFRIEKPEDQPTAGTGGRAKIQVPAPIAVNKDEWPVFGWDATSVAEVKDDGNDTKIFVNIDNQHLVRLIASGGYQEVGLKRMRNNFLLYAAFYAWMRFATLNGRELNLEGKDFEDYQAEELDRVAQTVVHSISAASRLEEDDL